jgi:hypothetical protein
MCQFYLKRVQWLYHTYLLSYLLTCLLSPWSRVPLEKLTGLQLVKKFHAIYGTRSLITAFTRTRLLSLSIASSLHSIPPHPTSWRSALILSSHLRLGLPSGLFPSGFPTKTLYTPLPSPYALHAPPISFFSILSQRLYHATLIVEICHIPRLFLMYQSLFEMITLRFSLPYFLSTFFPFHSVYQFQSDTPCSTVTSLPGIARASAYFTVRITWIPSLFEVSKPFKSLVWKILAVRVE